MLSREQQLDHNVNFISKGQLFLVRCFQCNPIYGVKNYGPAVASGTCSWCGWSEDSFAAWVKQVREGYETDPYPCGCD